MREGARDEVLAGVGQAQQAHVGHQRQLKMQVALVARRAFGVLARRAVDRRLEAGVAEAVKAALGNFHPLAVAGELTNQLGGGFINDARAQRHGNVEVDAVAAAAVRAAAVGAALRIEAPGEAEVGQSIEVGVGHGINAAAIAAITAVRATEGDELFAAKAHAAIAAIAGFDADSDFINEFHDTSSVGGGDAGWAQKSPGCRGFSACAGKRLRRAVRR